MSYSSPEFRGTGVEVAKAFDGFVSQQAEWDKTNSVEVAQGHARALRLIQNELGHLLAQYSEDISFVVQVFGTNSEPHALYNGTFTLRVGFSPRVGDAPSDPNDAAPPNGTN